MTDFKEATALIGRDVVVVNERHFPGAVRMKLTACILRRMRGGDGLYCQAEVADRSGAVYIVNLKDIEAAEEVVQ